MDEGPVKWRPINMAMFATDTACEEFARQWRHALRNPGAPWPSVNPAMIGALIGSEAQAAPPRRAGLLMIAPDNLTMIGRTLPAEHAIRAMRPEPDLDVLELIIEGPMMPAWHDPSVPPPRVHLVLTADHYDGGWQMDAALIHECTELGAWRVGTWQSAAAMMQALYGG